MSHSINEYSTLGYANVPTAQQDQEISDHYQGTVCSQAMISSRGINSFRDTNSEHSALILALQPISSQALRQWQMDNAEQIMDVGRIEAAKHLSECHVSTHTATAKSILGPVHSQQKASAISSYSVNHRDQWNQCNIQNG